MTILITGGAGFIGSHLAEHFHRRSEVFPPHRKHGSRAALDHRLFSKRFSISRARLKP
jgi:nucleoside-diphosphate-sugar epimerase